MGLDSSLAHWPRPRSGLNCPVARVANSHFTRRIRIWRSISELRVYKQNLWAGLPTVILSGRLRVWRSISGLRAVSHDKVLRHVFSRYNPGNSSDTLFWMRVFPWSRFGRDTATVAANSPYLPLERRIPFRGPPTLLPEIYASFASFYEKSSVEFRHPLYQYARHLARGWYFASPFIFTVHKL
jgi:hypothetical protein